MAKGGEALLMAAVPILAGGFLTFALYYVLKMVLKVTCNTQCFSPTNITFSLTFHTMQRNLCVYVCLFSAS
jgi:hypothetical protein